MEEMIFIVQNFFEDRDYERYGIELFEKKGISIKIWSAVYLLTTAANVKPIRKLTQKVVVYYPKSLEEINTKIKKNCKKEFLLLLDFDKSIPIRLELYKNKCHYSELRICPALDYAEEYARQNIIGKILYKKQFEGLKRKELLQSLLDTYFKFSWKKLKLIIGILYDMPQNIFYSTKKERRTMPFILQHCKSYEIHTLDYDNYLQEEKDNERTSLLKREPYLLYIDGAEIVEHPDVMQFKVDTISRGFVKRHKQDLHTFLERLETIYHRKTIIAGHPRVQYRGQEFGDREIVQFQTAQLVKYADAVIVSRSTAWSYIILYHKPVLFFYTSRKPERLNIGVMEEYFRRKAYDITDIKISDKALRQKVRKLDKEIRMKYTREYIKGKDSREEFFFEILTDIIQ